MANRSNWKGSEAKAAAMFPGGKRRTRVGGGSYAEVADDVKWLFDEQYVPGKIPRYIKLPIKAGQTHVPPIYIEVKKRARCELVTIYKKSESKYFTRKDDRLILVMHLKHDKHQYVLIKDTFFVELIHNWFNVQGFTLSPTKYFRRTR